MKKMIIKNQGEKYINEARNSLRIIEEQERESSLSNNLNNNNNNKEMKLIKFFICSKWLYIKKLQKNIKSKANIIRK